MLNEFESQQSANSLNKDKDDLNEHLLRLVLARPPLFNYRLPIEERTPFICNKLWRDVADELTPIYGPFGLERIKNKYKYHRKLYTRYQKAILKIQKTSQHDSTIYAPKHMEILWKIDAIIKDHKTNSINTINQRKNNVPTNICRTCLIENVAMESIFSLRLVNHKLVKITTMISMCTGLEFSIYDNFSSLICHSCVNAVSVAFEFRRKSWDSHDVLMQKALHQTKHVVESITSSSIKTLKLSDFISVPEIIDRPESPPGKAKNIVEFINKSDLVKKRKMAEYNNMSAVTDKLKEHAELTLDETVFRGKRYKCRYCGQTYLSSYFMIDHLENIHKFSIKSDTWLKCEKCPKSFPNLYRLSVHVKKHNPNKVICQQCGASIPRDRFAEHFRAHTGEKPYKCDLCDFRTAYISSIRNHRLKHTGEKKYKCQICGKAYQSASTRAEHTRTHSGVRPHICIICKKGFFRNQALLRHMQTHEPSKMFECEICNRKFSQKGPHKIHMMQHTGRRPHKCSECGKGFIQRHCWRTHMKNHHKIIVQ